MGIQAAPSSVMATFAAARLGVRQIDSGIIPPGGPYGDEARLHGAKDELQTRLRRIEGQVRGIQGMVDEDRYCIDVLTKTSAIQAALGKVALGLLDAQSEQVGAPFPATR